MTPSLMDLELGEVPPEGDPDRASMLAMQAEGASLLGLMIWITERYPQGLFVTRWVGRKSHSMSWDGYRFLKFALMHLLAHPYACLLYTSPSPRDGLLSRMPSSA